SQHFGACEVCGKIRVAQLKPYRHSVPLDLAQAAERFVAETPSAHSVQTSGESVENTVDVRADVKSPHLRIIADIHDHIDVFLRYNLDQSHEEFRGARSSGQYGVMHLPIVRTLLRRRCSAQTVQCFPQLRGRRTLTTRLYSHSMNPRISLFAGLTLISCALF